MPGSVVPGGCLSRLGLGPPERSASETPSPPSRPRRILGCPIARNGRRRRGCRRSRSAGWTAVETATRTGSWDSRCPSYQRVHFIFVSSLTFNLPFTSTNPPPPSSLPSSLPPWLLRLVLCRGIDRLRRPLDTGNDKWHAPQPHPTTCSPTICGPSIRFPQVSTAFPAPATAGPLGWCRWCTAARPASLASARGM